MREVSAFLRLTPAEGGWRVVVLDGAEDLNRNAANALLKMLEEPPPRAVLLLTCSAAGRLLPTIRSRCRRLRLAPLPEPLVAHLLGHALPEKLSEAERLRLAGLSGGSIGRALLLAEQGGVATAELAARTLREPLRLTTPDALKVADAIDRDDEAFSGFMDLLRAGLATAVRAAARGRADAAQVQALGLRSLADWVSVWQGLGTIQDETEGLHLDKREALVISFGLLAKGEVLA